MKYARSVFCTAVLLLLTACGTSNPPTTGTPIKSVPIVYVDSGFASPAQVLAFPGNSTGNPSPSSTISLPTLTIPVSIATDPAGNVYLGTYTDIREYTAGSSGAATPARSILLASSGITYPNAVTADATGNIYVADFPTSSIENFSAAASGSAAPSRILSGTLTGLTFPSQIALDGAGNLYVLNLNVQNPSSPSSILVFGPKANGNVAPDRVLNEIASGMTVDSSGDVYILPFGGVEVFAPGASGNATPIRTISDKFIASYGVPTDGIAVDSNGNIYIVTETTLPSSSPPTILCFSVTASGDAPPANVFTPAAWTPGLLSLATLAVH
jgi:sugar lactone lactonase YvrE